MWRPQETGQAQLNPSLAKQDAGSPEPPAATGRKHGCGGLAIFFLGSGAGGGTGRATAAPTQRARISAGMGWVLTALPLGADAGARWVPATSNQGRNIGAGEDWVTAALALDTVAGTHQTPAAFT